MVDRYLVRNVPTFDVDVERINVFELDEYYVFKHYFELDDAFDEVREFYNREEYRFEVPKDALKEVRERLADHYVELDVVDDVTEFCVVKRKHSDHPDLLFKNAICQESRRDYNIFVLKDKLTVEQAIMHGAEPLAETTLEIGI